MIIVVSGPGGAGKGTVVAAWRARNPRLWVNQSWTTRERRPGESPDAYVFATPEQFQERIDSGGFLEWVDFLDYARAVRCPTRHPVTTCCSRSTSTEPWRSSGAIRCPVHLPRSTVS